MDGRRRVGSGQHGRRVEVDSQTTTVLSITEVSGWSGRRRDGGAGRRQLDDREIKSRGVDRSISSNDRRVRRRRRVEQHLEATGTPSAGRRRGLMKL